LALLNPFGGRGLAPRKWLVAKEFFDLAYIDIELKHTERPMHAHEITKTEIQTG
jgi:sphingosine kinase